MSALSFNQDLDAKLVSIPAFEKNETSALRSEIVLGSPGAGCTGLGVCKIMLVRPSNIRYKCPVVSAWVCVTDKRRLRIRFQKNAMGLREMRRHFRWLLFQVLEPYELPDEVIRHLPLLANRTLQPGIYSVWETQEYLVVDF